MNSKTKNKNVNKQKGLHLAKKRDKKILITDTAINKVPYIKYKNIESVEYEILHTIAKKVLLIAKDENDSNEVAIIYQMGNAKISEESLGITLGNEHYVNPLSSSISYHILNTTRDCAVVCLHNHPTASIVSLYDIQFFIEYDSIKLMIIITNLGAINYIVKVDKYDKSKAIDLLNEAIDKHNVAKNLVGYQLAVKYFLKKAKV